MLPLNFTAIPSLNLSYLSLSDFFNSSKPLFLFVGSILIYSLFVFKFYRFLAKRDILELKLEKYSVDFTGYLKTVVKILFYILENLIVIPILIFFWFAVLGVILVVISKTQTANTILLISMAIVASVRIASYYNEDLAQEIAKIIPFSLLALFLVDISYFSIDKIIMTAQGLPSLWKNALYYLAVVVLMEFMLRLLKGIVWLFRKNEDSDAAGEPPAA